MAYCAIEDVIAMSQPKPMYSDVTVPTDNQVRDFIRLIYSEVDMKIVQAGYTLPITDPKALDFLKLTNVYGAASLAIEARVGSGNPSIGDWAGDLWNKYQSNLNRILSEPGILGVVSNTSRAPRSLATSRTVDGSDENYSDNAPMFRRDTQF